MKFISLFLSTLTILAFTVIAASPARAQDHLKVYAGFSNINSDLYAENLQGVNVSGQYKVYGYEQVKLEVVGDFSGHFRDGGPHVFQYLAGPQVSVDLFEKHLTPFARLLFGTTRQADVGRYTHSIGGGLDINLGRYGIRAIQFDHQTVDTLPLSVKRVGAGVFIKF